MNKKISPYIYLIIGLFVLSILIGLFSATLNPKEAHAIFKKMSSGFGFIRNFDYWMIFLFIFLNNALKSLIVLFSGFFLGIVPLYFIAANGEAIGLVLGVSFPITGWEKLALGLLPHGIFEIPALILTCSYGLWLGIQFYRKIKFKEPFKPALRYAWEKYIRIILPMLLIAALIETFITSAILRAYW